MARHETASLRYIQWEEKFRTAKPFSIFGEDLEGLPQQNYRTDWGDPQTIHDVRGHEPEYSLDDNGFAYFKHRFELANLDTETLEREYLPQVEALLMARIPKATEVKIYLWKLRSSDSAPAHNQPSDSVMNLTDPSNIAPPATAVHVDLSEEGSFRRVRHDMGDRAETLLRSRVQLVNVWHPVGRPIEDFPLAVCDGSTLDPEDLVHTDVFQPTFQTENILPVFNKNARWYYQSDQGPEDVLMFKNFDSNSQSKARYCPHVSFRPSKMPPTAMPRESIEVKALVFSSE